MPTNEERREIAEEIRKAAQHDFLGFPCFTSIALERFFNLEVKGTILGVNSYTRESAMRMADLIEPEPIPRFVHCCDRTLRCPLCGSKVVEYEDQ